MTQVGTTFLRYPATPATAFIAFTDRPTTTETFVVNGVTLTYLIGTLSDLDEDVIAITALVNDSVDPLIAGKVTARALPTGGSATQVRLYADAPGTSGNAITLTEDLTNATASGATFTGGTATADKEEVIVKHVIDAADATLGALIIDTEFTEIMEWSSVFYDAGLLTADVPAFAPSGGTMTITKGSGTTWAAGDIFIVTIAGYIESKTTS
jgi:hypothetical protein